MTVAKKKRAVWCTHADCPIGSDMASAEGQLWRGSYTSGDLEDHSLNIDRVFRVDSD